MNRASLVPSARVLFDQLQTRLIRCQRLMRWPGSTQFTQPSGSLVLTEGVQTPMMTMDLDPGNWVIIAGFFGVHGASVPGGEPFSFDVYLTTPDGTTLIDAASAVAFYPGLVTKTLTFYITYVVELTEVSTISLDVLWQHGGGASTGAINGRYMIGYPA